jgi:GTP-binding protein LepA
MDISKIRNFCIVAHIDHGKSTLADRILEYTGALSKRELREQTLDSIDIERERGITIKAKAVAMSYHPPGGDEYLLNLIDTPGHVDFSYEVSRSLAACEGALLLVDAAQGVEAQTVANAFLAIEAGLEIVPVINKVDLANARPDEVKDEMKAALGIDPNDVILASAKEGRGMPEMFEAILKRIPPPSGDANAPLQALIFDSHFDEYRGVIVYLRVRQGSIAVRDKIVMLGTKSQYEVLEVGAFRPKMEALGRLSAGEVGYVIANIKTIHDVRIGDTVAIAGSDVAPLRGYVEPKPMVFCGLYPTLNNEYDLLRKALEKLHLNDSSFTFEPDSSDALGFGFRCGFLGLLHMEIVQERLERESNVDLVQTAPNVPYQVTTTDGRTLVIDNPSKLPPENLIEEFREPIVRVSLIIPSTSIGALMQVCQDKRGRYIKTEYLGTARAMLTYDMPLAEIIFDFYDKLKSLTRGYGTMDYHLTGYEAADLVRLRILVGGTEVDALSSIVHREHSEYIGRQICQKLRKEIPRHLFEVALQAAIGGKIIARESIAPMRKNVIAKCYGGDVTRKRKLLEKQKEGKRRMKQVGNVEIPQKAFLAVLGTNVQK